MDKINIEYRNPNDLIPYPLNAKKHPVEQINHIASSIYEFGFDQPIVIDRKGMIIKGHGRYLASLKLGLQSVPVIVANLSDAMAKASRLADNKVAESDWDNDLLKSSIDSLLETIGSDDIDLQSFGFDMSVFDDLIQSEVVRESSNYSTVRENKVYDNDDIENVGSDSYESKIDEDKLDEVPEIESIETRVKSGDIWQLGKHYLLCGDCTIERNIRELVGDREIELMFTSPPYSDMRTYDEGTDISITKLNKIFSVWNDCVNYFAVNLGLKFKDCEVVEYWQEWIKEAKKQGLKLLAWNVWDKTKAGSVAHSSNMFYLTHEWIFIFGENRKKLNRIIPNQLDKYQSRHGKNFLDGVESVRRRNQDGSMTENSSPTYTHHQLHSVTQQTPELGKIRENHPATMPVGLPQKYIESMTNENDIVADPFLGSGTTLIACEKTNRICYGTELSPKYCDVILTRWEKLTGNTATLIRNIEE